MFPLTFGQVFDPKGSNEVGWEICRHDKFPLSLVYDIEELISDMVLF